MPQEPLTAEERASLLAGLLSESPATGQDAPAASSCGLGAAAWQNPGAAASSTDSTAQPGVLGYWEECNRRFAAGLAESLTAKLRMPVDVAWVGREQATAARFLLADVPGRCLIRCQANDSGRPVWLEIDLPVVLACLERMLGGSLGAGDSAQRPLTELEQRLTGKLAEHCLAVLRDSWPGTVSWAWTATALELAPRQMPQDPRLPLAVAEFRIGLGAVSGRIALALPWSLLASAAGASSGAAAGGTATVSVVVWRSCAEPGPLSELEVGDLIATDQRPGDPLEVNVDGRPRYRGTPGAVDGHKAVRIE